MESGTGAVEKAVARAETLSKSAIEAAEATIRVAQETITKANQPRKRLRKQSKPLGKR